MMTEVLFLFIVIDIIYVIYVILSEQQITTPVFCSSNADDSITQDDQNIAEQTSENNSPTSTERTGGTQATEIEGKVYKIEQEFAHVSATFPAKAKRLSHAAWDLVKHPSRYAEVGASLAESMAGESLGEIVGASLGTVFGPEGTVIGAEVGGMAGEVFGGRQGDKIAKKLLHHAGPESPLKEDLQKEGSAKVSSHAGKMIGGMIGNALFDNAGEEIGEAVGNNIGKIAGAFAFEHLEKLHIKNDNKPCLDDVAQTKSDLDQD
jgi:outer membrane lipoprotein SlyB